MGAALNDMSLLQNAKPAPCSHCEGVGHEPCPWCNSTGEELPYCVHRLIMSVACWTLVSRVHKKGLNFWGFPLRLSLRSVPMQERCG